MKVRIALMASVVVAGMTGCQTTANRPAPEPVKAAEPAPAKPVVPEGPAPGSPAAKAQSQTLVRQAAESLNEGNEEKARGEIAEALRLDPESKLGLCLNRGISADPERTLGRPFTKYTVRPSETLGRIAQRAFGESCEFYLLARYNGIRVPKQLAGGQVIRIPGKVPLAPPEPRRQGCRRIHWLRQPRRRRLPAAGDRRSVPRSRPCHHRNCGRRSTAIIAMHRPRSGVRISRPPSASGTRCWRWIRPTTWRARAARKRSNWIAGSSR